MIQRKILEDFKGAYMREVRLEVFTDSDDAIIWMENEVQQLIYEGFEDIKAELSLIDGTWRCGVITDSRQMEMNV